MTLPVPCHAADVFPALTGHVVDTAGLLSAPVKADLEQKLTAFEQKTSDQIVVVMLPDLGGAVIEDYGYRLGRQWGIGQKGKDNGLLLIIAAQEHKVRIEVGYGLEPVMTDAAANAIIRSVILPDFRSGKMEQGIAGGVQAITALLTSGDDSFFTADKLAENHHTGIAAGIFLQIILLVVFILFSRRHPFMAAMAGSQVFRTGSTGTGNWNAGGFRGNTATFGGGGGSFGGGGASGSW